MYREDAKNLFDERPAIACARSLSNGGQADAIFIVFLQDMKDAKILDDMNDLACIRACPMEDRLMPSPLCTSSMGRMIGTTGRWIKRKKLGKKGSDTQLPGSSVSGSCSCAVAP